MLAIYDPYVNPSDSYYHYIAFPVLSYVRSGWITLGTGTFWRSGGSTFDWVSKAGPQNIYAFYLRIDQQDIRLDYYDERHNAFPVLF